MKPVIFASPDWGAGDPIFIVFALLFFLIPIVVIVALIVVIVLGIREMLARERLDERR